jgi:hypothetical protein
MEIDAIRDHLAAFPGTLIVEANGDLFAIHDPDGDYEQRPRQGWATVVTSNSDGSAPVLDEPGAFRLNIGLTRAGFAELAGSLAGSGTAEPDVLHPHPIYGGLHWVSVLNPDRTWPQVAELLAAAHAFAVRKHENATRRKER